MSSDFIEDERGYIKLFDNEGKFIGYISTIDYTSMHYETNCDLSFAKRYVQADLLFS